MLTITADELNRFMQCNGYRLLPRDPVFEQRDTTIREEGNAAHWLATTVHSGAHTVEEMIDRKAPNGIYITSDIAEHVSDYLSAIDRSPNGINLMEWSYSLSGEGWQINGRADSVGVAGASLNVDDLKYGYSIVEPEMNWTLIAHAAGWVFQSKDIIPDQFTFTIHQPRAPHRDGRVRHWTVSKDHLFALYAKLADALSKPSDTLVTGPQCYKCPAFAGCPARQNAEMNAIDVSHMAYHAEVSDVDIADRMALIHRAEEMLKQAKKAYEEQIMFRLSSGRVIDNYAIENDLTNRVWHDYVTPELIAALFGLNATKPAMITPAQLEKLGASKDVVAMLATRKSKGSKLVRTNANKRATKFFGAK